MHIYVFGNPDLKMDSLPIKLLPQLKKKFPEHIFTILDPNEEWKVERNMLIIDTVMSIEEVTLFENLSHFLKTPRVTCHDFDAYTNLQFLLKLRKIESVTIIGVPTDSNKEITLLEITNILKQQSLKNELSQ